MKQAYAIGFSLTAIMVFMVLLVFCSVFLNPMVAGSLLMFGIFMWMIVSAWAIIWIFKNN